MNEKEYAGFWIRTLAAIIDTVLLMIVIFPLLTLIYGMGYWTSQSLALGFWDIVIAYILPIVVVIVFWIYKSATPGKMLTKLSIVDAKTGEALSKKQSIIRYLGYYVSMIPLLIGFLWVGFDKRKQGWHDKMAGTVVVKNVKPESVQSDNQV